MPQLLDKTDRTLSGTRVLIVEDEYYLADDLSRALSKAGAEVIGPAGSLLDAERLIDGGAFDCAVIDMNLRGDLSFALAERLNATGVPFVVASEYDSASLPESLRGVPHVEKPFHVSQVVQAVTALIAR